MRGQIPAFSRATATRSVDQALLQRNPAQYARWPVCGKKPGTVPCEDELCLPCKPRNSNPFLLLLLNMRDNTAVFSILNERSFCIQNPFGIEALKCSLCSLMFSFCIIALLGLDARTQAAFWTTILSLNHQRLFHQRDRLCWPWRFSNVGSVPQLQKKGACSV